MPQDVNDPEDGATAWTIRQDMEVAGFTKLATTLGLRSLLEKALLTTVNLREMDGSSYKGYTSTKTGLRWLLDNKDKLTLKIGETAPSSRASRSSVATRN